MHLDLDFDEKPKNSILPKIVGFVVALPVAAFFAIILASAIGYEPEAFPAQWSEWRQTSANTEASRRKAYIANGGTSAGVDIIAEFVENTRRAKIAEIHNMKGNYGAGIINKAHQLLAICTQDAHDMGACTQLSIESLFHDAAWYGDNVAQNNLIISLEEYYGITLERANSYDGFRYDDPVADQHKLH
jgi:hypothetical protein